jgi:CheY-like chemotaxis protein
MHRNTILICDDDEGILEMLEIILSGNGYQTVAVRNSLQVFDVIDKQQPGLMLLDLWMPVMSGDQVLKALRQNPETAQLPVVVISASRDGQQIAETAGANEFVAKPFDISTLLSVVSRYCSKQ